MSEGDTGGLGEMRVFAYAVYEKAERYLAVVDALAAARERFRLQLRPAEVAREMGGGGGADQVGAALEQLAEWGNVTRLYDPAAPDTLKEFYARRFLYQLTPEGIAAHEGVQAVRRVGLDGAGRLSGVLLPVIVERLEAILREVAEPDSGRIYPLFLDLFGAFAELADNAGRYMTDLAVETSVIASDDDSFVSYKRAVFAYLNEFVSRLLDLVPRIAALVEELEPHVERLVVAAAEADKAPTRDGEDNGVWRSFTSRWAGVRSWFVSTEREQAVADALRVAMVDAINRILSALARLNDRHMRKVNRETDFTQLARWFARLEGDSAHRLWDVAFGLYAARHFTEAGEDEGADRGSSFWDAAPVEVAPRLRASGARGGPGRAGKAADYSAAKTARLAQVRRARQEAQEALARLVGRTPCRLSDLGVLDRVEFGQFLAVVDAALRSRAEPDGTRRGAVAGVGVVLTPPPDGTQASVKTTEGVLTGPDYELEITLAAAPRSSLRTAAQ